MKQLMKFCLVLIVSLVIVMGISSQSDPRIHLKLADTHPDFYPTVMGDQEFARLVNWNSDNRISIEIYTSKKLGEEKAVLEQVQLGAGNVDIARVSLSIYSAFVPVTSVLQLPYVFRSQEHMWKVLNGPVGQELLAAGANAGFVGLCWYESGSRNFYTRNPVKTLADLRGMKIRVLQAPLVIAMVESLGAVAIPLDFGSVYSAIQSKTIDGAENNWPSYSATMHYEVAPFILVDEHTRVPEIMVMSKKVFDQLTTQQQEILRKAALESQPYQIQKWNEYEQKARDEVIKRGVTVATLSVSERQKFVDAMKPFYEKQTPEVQVLIKRIQEIK